VLDSLEVGEEYLPNAMEWSSELPALYLPVGNLQQLLLQLRGKSEERLKDNHRFNAYNELIMQLAERQKAKSISLNLDERLALARTERELQKALDEADPDADGEKKKDKDIVLDESLNILSDLADMSRPPDVVSQVEPAGAAATH